MAVQLVWVESEGMWDIWTTSAVRYATQEEAAQDGKTWAEAEELEFKES